MPGHNQQDLSQWKDTTVTYREHQYPLIGIISQGGSGPMIEVPLNQMRDNVDFTFSPQDVAIDNLPLVLFKLGEGFIVVVGRNHYEKAKAGKQKFIKGRLLSTPSLKKVRILPDMPPEPPAPFADRATHRPFDNLRHQQDRRPSGRSEYNAATRTTTETNSRGVTRRHRD